MLLMCLYIPVVCVYKILFLSTQILIFFFLAFRIISRVYYYLFFICYSPLACRVFKQGNFLFDITKISSILKNLGSSLTWFYNGYRIMWIQTSSSNRLSPSFIYTYLWHHCWCYLFFLIRLATYAITRYNFIYFFFNIFYFILFRYINCYFNSLLSMVKNIFYSNKIFFFNKY